MSAAEIPPSRPRRTIADETSTCANRATIMGSGPLSNWVRRSVPASRRYAFTNADESRKYAGIASPAVPNQLISKWASGHLDGLESARMPAFARPWIGPALVHHVNINSGAFRNPPRLLQLVLAALA